MCNYDEIYTCHTYLQSGDTRPIDSGSAITSNLVLSLGNVRLDVAAMAKLLSTSVELRPSVPRLLTVTTCSVVASELLGRAETAS